MSQDDTGVRTIAGLPHGEACATREYVGPIAHTPDGRIDTARTHVRCEAPGCENVILMSQSISFISCVATTGVTGLGSFIVQCGELQHHCCSPACAAVAHARCMGRHVYPAVQALFAAHESSMLTLDGPLSHVRITPAEADDALTARTLAALKERGTVSARQKRGTKRLATAGGAGQHGERQRDGGARQHKQPSPRKLHSVHAASIADAASGGITTKTAV